MLASAFEISDSSSFLQMKEAERRFAPPKEYPAAYATDVFLAVPLICSRKVDRNGPIWERDLSRAVLLGVVLRNHALRIATAGALAVFKRVHRGQKIRHLHCGVQQVNKIRWGDASAMSNNSTIAHSTSSGFGSAGCRSLFIALLTNFLHHVLGQRSVFEEFAG